MKINIDESWSAHLKDEFKKDYFIKLTKFLNKETKLHQIYPKGSDVFAAFNKCSFANLKVVIIGQDPYHGEGQANGLCFSVNEDISFPPSLRNIVTEVGDDTGAEIHKNGDLSHWAKQGVLLLNATLTVRANQAGSHQNQGWEEFTNAVIRKISDQKENVVFLLWGAYAKQKSAIIDKQKHCIFTSPHPSPLSAYRGFFGNKHFSQTNSYLTKHGLTTINW